MICDGAYAAGDRLEAVAAMAETGLPVMFHSGGDNIPHISGANNRPAAFERLLDVRGLRFSLAHLGWPWCDEFIGTFAKFVFAREMDGHGAHPDLYVDVTPGTPGLYRREAMRKLYLAGFDVRPRTFWGSDQVCNRYDPDWSRRISGATRRSSPNSNATPPRAPSATSAGPRAARTSRPRSSRTSGGNSTANPDLVHAGEREAAGGRATVPRGRRRAALRRRACRDGRSSAGRGSRNARRLP